MGIYLSPKHGVNPSVEQCFSCMKDVGVVLFGQIRGSGDAEAPRRVCLDTEPCNECKGYMKRGVILVSVDESKTEDEKNPYRSGGWIVIKVEAIKRLPFPEEIIKDILDKRIAFIADPVWDALGLPRGAAKEE